MAKPKIIFNAKDHPEIHSGYGIIVRHLIPRLAAHYGKDSILIHAPVYAKRIEDWNGIRVLPGLTHDYEDSLLLQHYTAEGCNLLITVGDWFQLRLIPQWAAEDKITWVQWAPYDFLNRPEFLHNTLRFALKVVPFCNDAGTRLKQLGLNNVTDAIYLGLDTELWQPFDLSTLLGAKNMLGFKDDTYNIVIVAANQTRKNIREMLEGIKLFHGANSNANARLYLHTTVEGDRNIELDLKELELESLTVMPNHYEIICGTFTEAQMTTVFHSADVVLDVCMEGFGLSQTQAQAMGVPVIFLNQGAGPELVRFGMEVPYYSVDRSHNLLKPIPNPAHIAEALKYLYERYKRGEKRSQSAVDWVQAYLSWDKIAAQWIEIIDEVIEIREKHSYDIPEPSDFLIERSKELVTLT